MACTCIGNGDQRVEEMIKDVKNGYYISNMKIPSIDMKRYNWSISCQYAQKIENGEITDLQRDVIVMGTAPEFFNSIDACGNDFTVRPITNCMLQLTLTRLPIITRFPFFYQTGLIIPGRPGYVSLSLYIYI